MSAPADVLGFISQCAICPQTALTRNQYPKAARFICPRCREVVGWGDVDVAQAEPTAFRVNASADGDEPLGEAPDLDLLRVLDV